MKAWRNLRVGLMMMVLRTCFAAAPAIAASADNPTVTIDGASLQVLHTFSTLEGRWPTSALLQDGTGRLYGANRFGGVSDGDGTVFSLRVDGSDFRVLHTFTNEQRPNGLMLSTNGRLYGTLDVGLAAFEMNRDGSGYRVLRSVPFSETARGLVGLLVDGAGDTLLGGIEGFGGYGGGGIGRMNKDGTGFTETHHLAFSFPYAVYVQPPLALGPDGRFFGVSGTASQQFGDSPAALGSLFAVQPDGSGFETLLDLGGLGWTPTSPGLVGSDGALYGIARASNVAHSILWKADATGATFTIVKEFHCDRDGTPYGAIVEGANGRLYGTTRVGENPCTAPFIFLNTRVFSVNRDGSDFAREWEELYRTPESVRLSGTRLFFRGLDGACYGGPQSFPGPLIRFQPGRAPGRPVVINCQPETRAAEGSRIVFVPAVRGAEPLSYNWSRDGIAISGATNSWFGIDGVQSSNYGTYTINIGNQLRTTQCSFAFSAPQPLKLSPPHPLPHDMELRVRGSDNLEFIIECSADLQAWHMVSGGELTDGQATVAISETAIGDCRFFRGRYLPSGLPER